MFHPLRCGAVAALVLALPVSAEPLPHFLQPNAVWNLDVSNAPLRSNSEQMMTHLESISTTRRGSDCRVSTGLNPGCWGGDGSASKNIRFQMDLTMYVRHADGSTPTAEVVAWPGDATPEDPYYYGDCDEPGPQSQFPVPLGGGVEGSDPPDYSCPSPGDDCHLLVANDATHVLYESYQTDSLDDAGLHTHCALRWDLNRVYPRYGRGEHCTSADGAGFPIAPLLFNADEVHAAAQNQGDLGHAIRFILGNSRIMDDKYVHPASHGTTATSDTSPDAVPYGSRLRLKSTFDVDAFSANENVRVLLRTLQKYGMFLADGGTVPLTGESDYFTTHKWAELGIDTHSLWGVNPTDFDVIEAGDPRQVTFDCVRTPEDFLFIDGYEY